LEGKVDKVGKGQIDSHQLVFGVGVNHGSEAIADRKCVRRKVWLGVEPEKRLDGLGHEVEGGNIV